MSTKAIEALNRIKDFVCGDRVPRWSTDERVFASREAISNACDEALASLEADAAMGEPVASCEYGLAPLTEVEACPHCGGPIKATRPHHSTEEARDAERYRWLAERCRRTPEHWGGRWSIVIDGPAPEQAASRIAVDAAIDAAMQAQKGGEQ
jgi:rRNA maturation protein Nop10